MSTSPINSPYPHKFANFSNFFKNHLEQRSNQVPISSITKIPRTQNGYLQTACEISSTFEIKPPIHPRNQFPHQIATTHTASDQSHQKISSKRSKKFLSAKCFTNFRPQLADITTSLEIRPRTLQSRQCQSPNFLASATEIFSFNLAFFSLSCAHITVATGYESTGR